MKRLKKENVSLKNTIRELLQGRHDIQLDGESQVDMETILEAATVNHPTLLASQLQKNDPTGTLQSFWEEQVERSKSTDKRKKWNPVVLRFMLHLWERMGEKNFRLLEKEKVGVHVIVMSHLAKFMLCSVSQVLLLPSKRHLVRLKRKFSSLSNVDPAIYKQLRKLVSYSHTTCMEHTLHNNDARAGTHA